MKKVLFLTYIPSSPLENNILSLLERDSLLSRSFDCIFYDLSEGEIGYWQLTRRLSAIVQSERIDTCYLIPSADRGITLRDCVVKDTLCRLKQSLIIHYPECTHTSWMSLLLRRFFFAGQRVVISDWRDYTLVKQYTVQENILVCPQVDGVHITPDDFEKKLCSILALAST